MSSTLAPARAPVFSPAAVVASCVGFVLIGALQALYGPAIPAFREEFGLSPSAAGLGLSAHFVGGVAGVLLFDRLFGRIGNRRILGASYLLMALGAAGFAPPPERPPPPAPPPPARSRLRRHRLRPEPAVRGRLRPPFHRDAEHSQRALRRGRDPRPGTDRRGGCRTLSGGLPRLRARQPAVAAVPEGRTEPGAPAVRHHSRLPRRSRPQPGLGALRVRRPVRPARGHRGGRRRLGAHPSADRGIRRR